MLVQGQNIASAPTARASGNPNLLQLQLGEAAVSQLLPRYATLAWSGKVFSAYSAAQATSLAGTAMVGLQLYNGSPVSGAGAVNLVLLKAAGNIIVTTAALTGIVLVTGVGQTSAPTGQTAATRSSNNLIGGAGPTALALNAGTFTNAPTAIWPLLHNTAAISATGEDPGWLIDFEGSIIIPPQTYAAVAAVGAASSAGGVNAGFMWAELPI